MIPLTNELARRKTSLQVYVSLGKPQMVIQLLNWTCQSLKITDEEEDARERKRSKENESGMQVS